MDVERFYKLHIVSKYRELAAWRGEANGDRFPALQLPRNLAQVSAGPFRRYGFRPEQLAPDLTSGSGQAEAML